MKLRRGSAAFSLVEVVIALAIFVFAILVIVALLPMGVSASRISVEETQAAGILTALEADLRNTHPLAQPSGQSLLFHLPLPYMMNSGQVVLNSALQLNTVYTTGLDRTQSCVAVTSLPRPIFQASVIYMRLPAAGSLQPIEARLIVSWPCLNTTHPSDLTDLTKVSGFVEGYAAFPLP